MISQERSPTSGGTIRVHRVRTIMPAAFTVWIDDVQVGMLYSGEVADVQVPSGSHHLQLRWKRLWSVLGARDSETLYFLVEPGEVIHFDSKHIFRGIDGISLWRLDAPATVPSASGATDTRILRMTETTRIEEWLGEDVLLIDNRTSPAPVTRSLKARREWTRTLTLGENHRRTVGGEAGVSLLWLSVKGSIEAELQRTLSLAIGSTHLFEEEISVPVPEHTAVRIVLGWKRIWQCGDASVVLPDNSMHIVPYQFVVRVTFDLRNEGVARHADG
jgi:hypothetical protein